MSQLRATLTHVPVVCFSQKLVYEGGDMSEEFVETEYYKDLGCVGKQHHTVTGFAPPSYSLIVGDVQLFITGLAV
jgi:hypothetical protein